MVKIRVIALILCMFVVASTATAQMRTFLSPGIKIGFQPGGGMFAGLEISYTFMPAAYKTTYGAVFNLDLLRSGGYKIHLGVQGSNVLGVELGPTYAKERSKPAEWGYSGSVFGLVVFMPYYTFTDLFGREIHEGGLLMKLHMQTNGPELGSLFKT